MGLPTPLTPPPFDAVKLMDGRRVQLGRALGRGSMGTVYRGTVESGYGVHRPVALKLFSVIASDDQEIVIQGLARAAQRVACIRHPNVAQVYDFGTTELQPYIVSELVDGMSLRELVDLHATRGRRLSLDLALFIALEIAEGLGGARLGRDAAGLQMGMVHADLSTREVLLSWFGEVKITDFELSCARQASSSVRRLSQLARRADTMAPEVACGMPGDARSDVFSLGIVLREMLVGPRFSKDTGDAEALGFARQGVVHESWLKPHLPEELTRIMQRAIAPEPSERYPQAAAMAYDLRRVALTLGVGDGRVFLRSALQAEREERSDATVEHPSGARARSSPKPPPPRRQSSPSFGESPIAPYAAPLGRTVEDEELLEDDDEG